jgi:hypothetical protein
VPLATRALKFPKNKKKDAPSLRLQLIDMSGTKRARTQQQDGALDNLPGREQFLLASPEMQTRLGRKYCDEAELLPLLIAHGLVRRVRTSDVQVRPLGGDSFKITLDVSKPNVGEAMAEIARLQGTAGE